MRRPRPLARRPATAHDDRVVRWVSIVVVGVLGCSAENGAFGLPIDGGGSASGDGDSTGAPVGGSDDRGGGDTQAGGSGGGGDETAGTTGDAKPPAMEGTWWGCELGLGGTSPEDDCALLDDDGIRFLPDGTLELVWWAQAPSDGCQSSGPGPGACFPFDHPDPGPFESVVWGTWTVEPSVDELSADEVALFIEGTTCKTNITWILPTDRPYAQVTAEQDFACGIVGGDEPDAKALGPWYLRRLDP